MSADPRYNILRNSADNKSGHDKFMMDHIKAMVILA